MATNLSQHKRMAMGQPIRRAMGGGVPVLPSQAQATLPPQAGGAMRPPMPSQAGGPNGMPSQAFGGNRPPMPSQAAGLANLPPQAFGGGRPTGMGQVPPQPAMKRGGAVKKAMGGPVLKTGKAESPITKARHSNGIPGMKKGGSKGKR